MNGKTVKLLKKFATSKLYTQKRYQQMKGYYLSLSSVERTEFKQQMKDQLDGQ